MERPHTPEILKKKLVFGNHDQIAAIKDYSERYDKYQTK